MSADADLAREALSYLTSSGRINSRRLEMPVDAESRPLPWHTYAAIDLLSRCVRPDMTVFEFGSGNSTLWWAERVETVVSVVDGRDRVNCARQCLSALRDDGFILCNDSQRRRYGPGQRFLARRGFKQLPLAGHGPINPEPETSVFYRPANCFHL